MLSLAPTSGFRGERLARGGSPRMLGALPRQGSFRGFAPPLRFGLVLAIVPSLSRPGQRHLRPLARRAFSAGSPSARWADLATSTSEVTMTEALVEEAMSRFGRKQRKGVYLYQILAVAFSLPTKNAGRTAIKRGEVCVDGERVASSNAALPELGSVMTLRTTSDKVPEDIERRLAAWNGLRQSRSEAQIRLLYEDPEVGWGVVNKPAGLDSSPWDESRSKGRFTFQAYLPAVIGPPTKGVPCRGPRVCHRLDFRVGGPLVVATSEEAIRNLMFRFAEQLVDKEYRAIVCGKVEEEGASFTVDAPVDGKAACTDIQVLKVAKCPHHGHLTELALSPRQGRYRQLRRHCAEVLGAPIVNEDAGVVIAAAEAWRLQGKALPSALVKPVGRGKGNLFLQKLRVSLPPPEDLNSSERITVAVPPSDRFDLLMDSSARAFEYGWRTDARGETKLLEDAGA